MKPPHVLPPHPPLQPRPKPWCRRESASTTPPASTPDPLAAQQQILRDAIAKLERQTPPDSPIGNIVHRGLLLGFRHALADHHDGGCLANPGVECIAVRDARAVLAGELP